MREAIDGVECPLCNETTNDVDQQSDTAYCHSPCPVETFTVTRAIDYNQND